MPKSHFCAAGDSTCAQCDILGRLTSCALGLLFCSNISRCLRGTCAAIIIHAALAASMAAQPQDAPEIALQPDVVVVERAFATLRNWVSAFETPRMDDAASRVEMTGATGVCIVLRRSGRVLGTGTDAGGDDLMLRRAAGRALNSVLSDPALSTLSSKLRQQEVNDPNAAITVDALRREIGHSIIIELEVAGRLSPLVGRSLEQLARKLEPGLDGIALRLKQDMHLTFPAHWRATNAGGDMGRLLLNAALTSGVPVREVNDLPTREDVGFYKFHTITLWQGSPEDQPVHTIRGDSVIPLQSITRQHVVSLANGLANHLISAMWPQPPEINGEPMQREPLGICGDYSVVADDYRPLVASPSHQALAALALARYAEAVKFGIDQETATRALESARQIMRDLAVTATGEADPLADLSACAAIVYAMATLQNLRDDAAVQQLGESALTRVRESFDPASGFAERSTDGDRTRAIHPHTQAMLAGAMCLAMNPADPVDVQRTRAALDEVWRSVPQGQQVGLLPWIGWAEQRFAAATKQPLHHAEELQLLIDVLDRAMVNAPPHGEDQSSLQLLGGIALQSESESFAGPIATVQTVRPAAWLVGASTSPVLVPATDRAAHQNRCMNIMRFLIQLSVREEHRGWLRSPQRALGGLRSALWDSDQPLPAQALGLLSAVETLTILREQP